MTEGLLPLELDRVGHRYGRNVVLRAIDLRLDPGEILGVVGHNGSGKTTLLAIAAGLLRPSTGERRLGGRPATHAPDHRAGLALVAHGPQLYPRLSARENLELWVDLRHSAGFESLDPARALQRVGLADHTDRDDRPVGGFSRGMLQRVALARALVGRPDVLLLDEPFTALDREGGSLLRAVLGEERDRGAAILLSSHDLSVLGELADRVVELRDGGLGGELRRGGADPDEFRARVLALAGEGEV